MKKNFLALAAIVIAIGAAAFTAKETTGTREVHFADYFYRFTGTAGQESDVTKWQQMTPGAYDSLLCEGSTKACKITNTTNASGHPTSVPLSGGLPQEGTINRIVENKN